MDKVLIFLISAILMASMSACSFVKDRFFKQESNEKQPQQFQEEQQEEENKPIPVSPPHS